MLEVESLTVAYGGLRALTNVSIEVKTGELVCVVGPNGAGKSTLFKTISGTVLPRSGKVLFEGVDLSTVSAARRGHLGIAHVPEGREVFRSMSVMENLEMGAWAEAGRSRFAETLERVFSLFPVLAERRDQLAGTLSGGQQQMLAIGRGLASRPKLMMLDEPSMGLAPAVADTIFESISQLHREGEMAILLVEQRVAEAMEYSNRGYVLQTGEVILSGKFDELSKDDRIRRAYFGM
ncbi:amino acid/amide ABC transporter ATP-binding protein 2 (HAAT family) [Mesorhizobium sp. J18]|uniref:ABC transporter ATP-binding protein n=1 Tax=Mesorhizobium sp. J18 TaxID=935263 RepID=UPI00119BC7FA|nr:ABC transporter ATP-binding protein [Mesorhizobium sp. J18]TWG94257.1 amino acid/amide ABC transporter ATP-binding protein 2 (HAAT family) [Mesorhizobium sp. J18]